ncbi:MAG: ABC transporter permease [Deltaproteobacteria bacterium]|nr:ABC transporter permease [Deltaproteobacteria bacterium]
MQDLLASLRFSIRLLRRNGLTTTLAVLALALGIGLTAAMYSVIYALVIKDLPFEGGDRLYYLGRSHLALGIESMEVTQHDFADWQRQQTAFEDIAGFSFTSVNLVVDERPVLFPTSEITPNFLRLLRVQPVLGRDFEEADAEPGAPDVLLLSYDLWQSLYRGQESAIGSNIEVGGSPMTIIGVMPERFEFPKQQSLWLPLRLRPQGLPRSQARAFNVIGRLAPSHSADQAREELSGIAARLAQQYPETNKGVDSLVQPYKEKFVDKTTRSLLWVMLGAVSLVLLIACVNVANLLLARASARSKELAIRSALGSSRERVIFQLLADSLLIAAIGGALGLGVLQGCIGWLNRLIATLQPPFWFHLQIDAGILTFVVAIALASALVAGLLPALQATRPNLNEILNDSAQGGSSLRLGVLSRSLLVFEIALATALLLCAGLTIRTLVNLQDFTFKFDSEKIYTADIWPSGETIPNDELGVFYRRLLENLEARQEVERASLGTSLPTNWAPVAPYAVDGEIFPTLNAMPRANFFRVTPGYLESFRIVPQEGRLFDVRDSPESRSVALVNLSFAAREWPGQSPIGRIVRFGSEDKDHWRTVVGVVPDQPINDLDHHIDRDLDLSGIYVPFAQSPQRGMTVVLSTKSGARNLEQLVRDELAPLTPYDAPYNLRTMQDILDLNTFQNRILSIIFSAFAIAAALLTAIGLYGVMAFAVGQRTQEIGIRMAYGARRRQVLGLVLRQGLRQTLLGLSLGWILAYTLARLMSVVLYQVSPFDLASYTTTTLLLGLIALLACLIPARRAATLDPVQALRDS